MSVEANIQHNEQRSRDWWKPIVLLVAIVAILVLAKVFGVGQELGALRGWIKTLGGWGPLVFVLLYVVATVAALPGSALTVAAGALFGSVLGVISVSIASTLGASLAFASLYSGFPTGETFPLDSHC